MLEDAPSIQSYINGQLVQFVNVDVDRQLCRGAAGGSEVQGLLTSRNVPVYAGGTAAGNKGEQLFKGMNSMRGSAYLEPDWVVVSPSDYEAIRLLKGNQGRLYGGGPFFGPYGGPQGPAGAASGVTSAVVDQLWSKDVYISAAVGAGTAIVGTRAAASVMARGGVSVEATNSHGSYLPGYCGYSL
jgi:HK97 family phage major capsid protein